jgi:hypothetical protein
MAFAACLLTCLLACLPREEQGGRDEPTLRLHCHLLQHHCISGDWRAMLHQVKFSIISEAVFALDTFTCG